MINEQSSPTPAEASGAETKLNFGLFLHKSLKYWWLYAISVVLIGGCTALYLKTINSTYTTYATVMFNQNEDDDSSTKGSLGSLMASFSMGSSGVNVTDEILRMQSHSAIKRVVKECDLHKDYTSSRSFFRKDVVYFQNSPIEIETAPGVLDTIEYATQFELKISDKGKKLHLKVKQGVYKTVFDGPIPKLPYTVKTPLGSFTLTPTAFYRPENNMTFMANIKNLDEAAKDAFVNIDTYLTEKKSNSVTVKVDDVNSKRARAIANKMIELYNEYSVADRSAQSKATLDFLNDRLLTLYGDLEKSGTGIAAYKERHMLVDPKAEAEYMLKIKSGADANLVEQEAQLGVLMMLRDFLKADVNRTSLIPITVMPSNDSRSINEAIQTYNDLVLQLVQVQSSAKGNNSAMRQLENQITALRSNMLSSLDRSISAAQIAIDRTNRENSTANTRISSMPRMEQELTNLMRDNEIKNRIYAFLLQRREEAEVKLARTLPTGKVIDEAWTNSDTKRPKKGLTLLGALVLAMLIPGVIVFCKCRSSIMTVNRQAVRRKEKEFEQELS